MSYLLDTSVLSETVRRRPSRAVMGWLKDVPNEALYISVLTLAQVRKGVEQLFSSQPRERLRLWLEHELATWFGERVLPIDRAVADR